MQFLALYWGHFLGMTFVFYLAAMILQLRNMGQIANFDFRPGSFIGRFALVFVLGMAGTLSGILFLVGVAANLAGR